MKSNPDQNINDYFLQQSSPLPLLTTPHSPHKTSQSMDNIDDDNENNNSSNSNNDMSSNSNNDNYSNSNKENKSNTDIHTSLNTKYKPNYNKGCIDINSDFEQNNISEYINDDGKFTKMIKISFDINQFLSRKESIDTLLR